MLVSIHPLISQLVILTRTKCPNRLSILSNSYKAYNIWPKDSAQTGNSRMNYFIYVHSRMTTVFKQTNLIPTEYLKGSSFRQGRDPGPAAHDYRSRKQRDQGLLLASCLYHPLSPTFIRISVVAKEPKRAKNSDGLSRRWMKRVWGTPNDSLE